MLPREFKELDCTTSVFCTTIMALMTDDYSLDKLVKIHLEDFVNLLQKR